ncbi:polar amino acid transport system substrate-binding protein [Lachnospiraceae bacterium C7]|nr:polar amino acid transport system substrate-binding protein [Lachnospiraceae bacterium C7]
MTVKKLKISFLVLIAILFVILEVLNFTTKKGNDAESSQSTAKREDTFVVGFDQNFPPFGYKDKNGEYTGFDIDLAKECAKRMNKKLVLRPIDWDSKDMELETKNIDCIWNGFTINGRENDYEWTKPYMDNSQVVVVRKDSGIKKLEDLSGKVVDVQMDSSAETALKSDENKALLESFKGNTTKAVADYNTAMMDLESSAADAVAMDIFVAKDQIKGKEDKFIILDDQISTEQYGVGFYKGNTKLKNEVEKTMKEMVKDKTFKKISEKWFDTDVCILK